MALRQRAGLDVGLRERLCGQIRQALGQREPLGLLAPQAERANQALARGVAAALAARGVRPGLGTVLANEEVTAEDDPTLDGHAPLAPWVALAFDGSAAAAREAERVPDTYRAAQAAVTDAHTRHPHSQIWGEGCRRRHSACTCRLRWSQPYRFR